MILPSKSVSYAEIPQETERVRDQHWIIVRRQVIAYGP